MHWLVAKFLAEWRSNRNLAFLARTSVGDMLAYKLAKIGFIIDSMTFKYRRKITITEQSGSDLTDYQVLIELNSTNFDFSHAQTNGEDIRFTDASGNLLDYWIEEWDAVNEKAKVWVKVPSIPANSEIEIYMYYGNPEVASASDGDAVFEFFDDFGGTELDASKWEVTAGSVGVENSILKPTAGDSNTHVQTLNTVCSLNAILEVRAQPQNDSDFYWLGTKDTDELNRICRHFDTPTKRAETYDGASTTTDISSYWPDAGVWNIWGIKRAGNSKVIFTMNRAKIAEHTTNIPTSSHKIALRLSGNAPGKLWVDWVLVRKYADPEPSYEIEGAIIPVLPWPMVGFDSQKRNYKPEYKGIITTPGTLWGYDASDHVMPCICLDINDDEELEVLYGISNSALDCRSASDGSLLWSFSVSFSPYHPHVGNAVDVNEDGKLEMPVPDTDGAVHLIDRDGGQVWANDVAADIAYYCHIIDVDNDGNSEVIMGSKDGHLYCLDKDGNLKWSYDTGLVLDNGLTITDVNNDDYLEILVGGWSSGATSFHCIKHDGTLLWSYDTGSTECQGFNCVEDINDDNILEVFVGTDNDVGDHICLNAKDGTLVWSNHLGGDTKASGQSCGDMNSDGAKEVIWASEYGETRCMDKDGNTVWTVEPSVQENAFSIPPVCDIDKDGTLEVLRYDASTRLFCLNAETGNEEWDYTDGFTDYPSYGILVADINKDNRVELIVGDRGGHLRCVGPA